jgi:ADP-dependent NAD(P)H-hydrate dehydratase / NAD(P)H-hydrate epimerase
MQQDYWVKQTDTPLFEDVVWSRPEMRSSAGKLFIVGGHSESFIQPALAYDAATKAGIGVARVLMPQTLAKTLRKSYPLAEYATANRSGSFSKNALAELLMGAHWADAVHLAGDFGKNSETIAMLDNFASKYTGILALSQDSADHFCHQPTALLARKTSLLVLGIDQLRVLGSALKTPYAFTSDIALVPLVEQLHELTLKLPHLYIMVVHNQHLVAAVGGRVASMSLTYTSTTEIAASAVTWWLQQPTKSFEAIVSSQSQLKL